MFRDWEPGKGGWTARHKGNARATSIALLMPACAALAQYPKVSSLVLLILAFVVMAMATRMVSAMAKITTRARVKEKMVHASRDAGFCYVLYAHVFNCTK